MKKVFWLLGTLAVVTTAYGARQLYLLYQAGIKVFGVNIVSLSAKSIKLKLFTEIDNKGDISSQIKNQHYDVLINGVVVSSINSTNEIHINSNGKTIIPIDIDIAGEKLVNIGASNIANLLLDRSKIIIEVKGYLSLKAGVISLKNYPIDIKYNLQELIDIEKTPKTT